MADTLQWVAPPDGAELSIVQATPHFKQKRMWLRDGAPGVCGTQGSAPGVAEAAPGVAGDAADPAILSFGLGEERPAIRLRACSLRRGGSGTRGHCKGWQARRLRCCVFSLLQSVTKKVGKSDEFDAVFSFASKRCAMS